MPDTQVAWHSFSKAAGIGLLQGCPAKHARLPVPRGTIIVRYFFLRMAALSMSPKEPVLPGAN